MFDSRNARLSTRGIVALFILLASPVTLVAADHLNVSTGMTLTGGPLALRGFDAVAYQTEGAARPGSAEHAVLHDGAVYRFANAENLATFEKDPARYLPAYGGFCAYGVALGAKFDGDPEVFKIVNGRLFLNLNPGIQSKWEEDVKGNVKNADKTWKKIHDTSITTLAAE